MNFISLFSIHQIMEKDILHDSPTVMFCGTPCTYCSNDKERCKGALKQKSIRIFLITFLKLKL